MGVAEQAAENDEVAANRASGTLAEVKPAPGGRIARRGSGAGNELDMQPPDSTAEESARAQSGDRRRSKRWIV